MKILVAVKRVIDYNVKVRVKADGSDVDLANVKMALNPFCEIAIEQAMRLKESGQANEVVAVSVGDKACEEQLRAAMALGADRAIRVDTQEAADPLSIAKLLASIARQESPDLVLLGKQAIDSDNNQTGQMLAALLDWGQGTFAYSMELKGDSVDVTREIDGGLQTLNLNLPAVITTDLRLNEPRYAKLPDIMKAKRKPLEVKEPEQLNVTLSQNLKLLKVEAPPVRQAGIKVGNVEALVEKLKNEARVI
ncbi:electron transfer flavoprotein subunit beta/FixA family protein [Marinobacterium litorale]|uniref:electron transfer flavoprotein subunit beta/FixA family protein n=1 Tax=Marinobacterium litorale TaxID=404770 RepID=UPI00041563CF|nr:electron transfer flavoprotein subunit beta/FixA family protein [Marinobacterium litorale]